MESIYKAAEQRAPEEMCGFVLEENGIEKFIEVKNIAENKNCLLYTSDAADE